MDDKFNEFDDRDEEKVDPIEDALKESSKADELIKKAEMLLQKGKEKWSESTEGLDEKLSDGLKKTGEFMGESMKETGRFLKETTKETGRFFKEGKEQAEEFLKEKVAPKAKEAKENWDKKVDDWTDQLKDYSEQPIKKTEGSDLDESFMDVHSDFFKKAEKWADKFDEEEERKKAKPGDIKITENPDAKNPKDGDDKLHGFEDRDGDGDDLIDDAIFDV